MRSQRAVRVHMAMGTALALGLLGACSRSSIGAEAPVWITAGIRPPHGRTSRAGFVAAIQRRAEAEAPTTSPEWCSSAAALVEGIEGCSEKDAENWLRDGFAWSRSSLRFWRTTRKNALPNPESVQRVVEWLKKRDLARRDWVKKFPQVVGLDAEELDEAKATAPSYLKKDEVYLKAITSNPQLVGKNYNCLEEHESCQGKCARCWNT
mmetsp:Transcript_7138/g.26105  ORF Transcript_7138/g.26105 Transcript_7138/m.26105 type:complete len:208 (+) Transcript_7138:85-708(+)